MNEQELRKKVVSIATSYLGCKESDGSHKKIIDGYNKASLPLPVGYKVTYQDPWCATYVSFISGEAGLSDIMPRECSCSRMIALYQKIGRWVEDDSYTPQIADILFYDWEDNTVGDNKGSADHVGIVVSVNGKTIKVIEGNINNSVGYRTIQINGKCIRGYGIPNYASKVVTNNNANSEATNNASTALKYKVGDIVKFVGNTHYATASSTSPKQCKSGTAKVTNISKNSKHPYHLVAEKGKGSTVYGWVDEVSISGKVSNTSSSGAGTGTNNKVNSNAKVDYAKSFSKSLAGTYKTTAGLNMRSGASTSKTVITVIPKGGKVTCHGYYTTTNGVKWYYVSYKDTKGVNYNGFVSSNYLSK